MSKLHMHAEELETLMDEYSQARDELYDAKIIYNALLDEIKERAPFEAGRYRVEMRPDGAIVISTKYGLSPETSSVASTVRI